MANSTRKIPVKILLTLLALLFSMAYVRESFAAPGKLSAVKTQKFMKTYCIHINSRLGDLSNIVDTLRKLIESMQALDQDMIGFGLELNSPLKCLPNASALVKIPDVGQLAQCLGGFDLNVRFPGLDGISSCLSSLLPKLNISADNFDPSKILACMANTNLALDLTALTELLRQALNLLRNILNSLLELLPSIQVLFTPDVLAKLNLLAGLCAEAGYGQRKARRARLKH